MTTPRPNKLAQLSAPVLLFIHGLPRFVFPTFTAALLLGGLFVKSGFVGGILLLALDLVLGWLIALSWQLLTPSARLIRSIMLVVVIWYAFGRFTGTY